MRYGQWQEAIKARECVESSLRNASERYVYYERLLGKSADEIEMPVAHPVGPSRPDALPVLGT